tara:strand:- start:3564 stop:3965 length:402 start_codon:yes stop_codon:yes gene_type:complete
MKNDSEISYYISLASLLNERQDPGDAKPGESHSFTQSTRGPQVKTAKEKAALAKKQLDARLKKRAKEKTYPSDRPVPKGDTKSDSYRIHQVMAKAEKEKNQKSRRSVSSFQNKKPIVGSDEHFLGHGKKKGKK